MDKYIALNIEHKKWLNKFDKKTSTYALLIVPLRSSKLDIGSSYSLKTHLHELFGDPFLIIDPDRKVVKHITFYGGVNYVQLILKSIVKKSHI